MKTFDEMWAEENCQFGPLEKAQVKMGWDMRQSTNLCYSQAWDLKVKEGYQYGQDARDNVRQGWDLHIKAERACLTCLHRCMDMDMEPYCYADAVVANARFGKILARGRPVECGPEGKLWQLDTRGTQH